jgi:hypothetical protein
MKSLTTIRTVPNNPEWFCEISASAAAKPPRMIGVCVTKEESFHGSALRKRFSEQPR